jgi:toxin FitB
MLVDSNILIYAAQPAHAHLRRFIADHAPAVSAVSYVEVLGYHQLDDQEQQYLEEFFRLARVLPLSQAVLDQAVALRQQRRMSLESRDTIPIFIILNSPPDFPTKRK